MVGKKGFLKTIEAIIAVLLLLGFFIYMVPNNEENIASAPQDIQLRQDAILDELISNGGYRACLLSNEYEDCKIVSGLENFISSTINPKLEIYGFATQLCDDPGDCDPILPLEAEDKKIYAGDIIITDDGNEVVIFKLFIWLK